MILKKIMVLTFSLFTAFNAFAKDCSDTAVTQTELNQCFQQKNLNAESKLAVLYKLLEKTHQDDQAFLQKLKTSQKVWMQYRDAQVALKYPHGNFGSAYPMCVSAYITQLTEAQIALLDKILNREEGDVCA